MQQEESGRRAVLVQSLDMLRIIIRLKGPIDLGSTMRILGGEVLVGSAQGDKDPALVSKQSALAWEA
jgi:hypothetical protein